MGMIFGKSGYPQRMVENDWTKVLGWPGYRVYQHEIDEKAKTLQTWEPELDFRWLWAEGGRSSP